MLEDALKIGNPATVTSFPGPKLPVIECHVTRRNFMLSVASRITPLWRSLEIPESELIPYLWTVGLHDQRPCSCVATSGKLTVHLLRPGFSPEFMGLVFSQTVEWKTSGITVKWSDPETPDYSARLTQDPFPELLCKNLKDKGETRTEWFGERHGHQWQWRRLLDVSL